MCKYEKIQKNIVESIKNSILYETEQMSESYSSYGDTCDQSWRVGNIAKLHRALDAASEKAIYGELHDVASNFQMGFIGYQEVMSQVFDLCRNRGGDELLFALMDQPGTKSQFAALVRALVKMFDCKGENAEVTQWLVE